MKGGSRKQELVLTLSILGRKVPSSNIKYRLVASTEVTISVIHRGVYGPSVNSKLSYRGLGN